MEGKPVVPARACIAAVPAGAIAVSGSQLPHQMVQSGAQVADELTHLDGPSDRHCRLAPAVDPTLSVLKLLAYDETGAF